MRSHVYVRPLLPTEQEIAACADAFKTANAYLPNNALAWPSTRVLVAEKAGIPILYQPVMTYLVLGSLAPALGASDTDLASAQHQITAATFYDASRAGIGRIICGGGHEATEAFCQRHDYVKLRYPMFRLKVL